MSTLRELRDCLSEYRRQRDVALARAEAAETERDAYAYRALTALAGAVPTPELGYLKDGGPGQLAADIMALRRLREATEAREQALRRRLLSCAAQMESCARALEDPNWQLNRKSMADWLFREADDARAALAAADVPRGGEEKP